MITPLTDLGVAFSSPGATPTPWSDVDSLLTEAEIYWVTTVHASGRPHVVPLIGIWQDSAFHFCTGVNEQKAVNLRTNQQVVITTGCNAYASGTDVVIEGLAEVITNDDLLNVLARAWKSKYGWEFGVADGHFTSEGGGPAPVFRVAPIKAFGFRRGDEGVQTRYRFPKN